MLTSAMAYTLLRFGIPLRGAIDIGDLVELLIDNGSMNKASILLGKGLTRAYKLENLQQWSGCLISAGAIEHFRNLDIPEKDRLTLENLVNTKTLLQYRVPLKGGKIQEYYVLNWPFYFETKPTEDEIRNYFKMHNKVIDTWDVENKIKNTINFINYSFTLQKNGS